MRNKALSMGLMVGITLAMTAWCQQQLLPQQNPVKPWLKKALNDLAALQTTNEAVSYTHLRAHET